MLQGYASTYRLPREDFFRACGRNLWRFIRLMIVAGIVMGIVAGALFGIRAPLLKTAGESTNELLPFYVSLASLLVIFLVMAALRIWFDLAQSGCGSERSARGAQVDWRGLPAYVADLGRLLASYVVTTIVAAIVLRGRALGVDEVCPARERVGRVFGEPADAAVAVDSALLAAWRGGDVLPAEYGGTDCCAVVHARPVVAPTVVEPVAAAPGGSAEPQAS